MIAVVAEASLKNDSSEDEDSNNMNSLLIDDVIIQETDSSDNEMVWQFGQDDHGILVTLLLMICLLVINLFAQTLLQKEMTANTTRFIIVWMNVSTKI